MAGKKKEDKKTLMQSMGVTRTVIRPREESDIQLREDRIGRYFKKYLNKFVFVEFSEEFMNRSKAGEVMRGVPIPLRRKEVKDFAGGEGVSMLVIAENMAWVMGCDPHFKHTGDYVKILDKLYGHKLFEGLMKEGRDAAERGEMDNACIHFRASLCIQYDYLHSMYSYARACRVMYENSRNEEYIGRFKAEALDWFELLTETHPRFAMGYYYLGYSYLNIGLYKKAVLAWEDFLKFGHNRKDRKEITRRIEQLQDPVRIESGCLSVTSGRYDEGIQVLEPYLQSRFKDWWPLHYYLGMAYNETGRTPDAVAEFKKTLMINGSHLETMRELLAIYEAQEDKQNIRKYSEKIRLIEEAQAEEQAKLLAETREEDKKLENEESQPLPKDKIEHFDLTEADELAGAPSGEALEETEHDAEREKAGGAPENKAGARGSDAGASKEESKMQKLDSGASNVNEEDENAPTEKKSLVKRLGKKK